LSDGDVERLERELAELRARMDAALKKRRTKRAGSAAGGWWQVRASNGCRPQSTRTQRLAGIAGALAVLFVAVAAAVHVSPTDAATSPICTRGLTTVVRDPRGLLPLTGNSISPAAAAALAAERRSARPQVVAASLAIADRQRGPAAKFECGARVWRRTVVVYITLRAFANSASLSERVDFVGRFKDGYHVWQVVH
jgi:hypothetical protein